MPDNQKEIIRQDSESGTDKSPLVPLRGNSTLPFTCGRMGFAAPQTNTHAIVLPDSPDAISISIKDAFESALSVKQVEYLGRHLAQNGIALILSLKAPIAPGSQEAVESEITQIQGLLFFDKMVAEIGQARKHGFWTVPFEEIALTLVPCEALPVNGWTGYLPLEMKLSDIQARFERAHELCNEIAERRSQWQKDHAEPLFDEIAELLKTATLSDSSSQIVTALRKRLLEDAHNIAGPSTHPLMESVFRTDATAFNTALSTASREAICNAIESFDEHLKAVSADIIQSKVQVFLDGLVADSAKLPDALPTLEDKKQFAKQLQAVLDRVGLSILTNHGVPGRFDAYHSGGTKGGGFRLRWSAQNDESLSTPFRPLTLAPKPLRRPKS